MKKVSCKTKSNDDLRPEYDFRGAQRGKHYKPLHEGYSVHIHRKDGTTEIRHYALTEGAVLLQPDVREYFPDSEAVNAALRSLVVLMAQMPRKPAGIAKKNRHAVKPVLAQRA